MLELMLKGYEFPKCSLEGQSLPGREYGMKEKGLQPPPVLRSLRHCFVWLGWRVQGCGIARYVNGEKDKDRLKEFELKRSLLCPGVHQKALSR